MEVCKKPNLNIPFYIPNLIGYFRLILIFIAHSWRNTFPTASLALYIVFASLDGLDGWAARKFNQCSAFGAWLDVIIDNFGRTLIWSNFEWGFLVSNLEWITFVCNHCHGAGWREKFLKDSFVTAPGFVKKVMGNGFKTPLGIMAIGGLHVLPIFMFGEAIQFFETHLPFLPSWAITIGYLCLLTGRSLCAMVELWCVQNHIKCLLMAGESKKST